MAKDFVCGHEGWPRIPDRHYEVQCVKHDESFCFGKTRKLFLIFKVIDGEHQGKTIFQAFNMRYDKRIRPGSKYYKVWCMANNWAKPSKNAKMSPRLFLNKIFKVKTRTVKPKQPNGKEMPKAFWYSVVDCIVEAIQS